MRKLWWFESVALLVASSCCSGCSSQAASSGTTTTTTTTTQTAYYVDCSQSSDGSGTQTSPWNSLTDVNSHTFAAGNSILLKRGVTCSNVMLAPAGSGASGNPILIDAYGTGSLPIINAGASNQSAVRLYNQQYWEIANLEIVGGSTYGVYIGGNQASTTLNHLYLTNLNVHGATGTSTTRGDSGEVYLATAGTGQTFSDVLINGVTAHDSKVSEGIYVSAGGAFTGSTSQTLGSNVTVENSTAYNVYGDGILIMEITTGVIKNSVVYNSGQCPSCGGTPSGLWEWFCHSCTIQNNESYANQTWNTHDGGDFDIDYYNNDNIVQYNYGHDAEGYCISVFGAESTTDTNNIVRYNICSNNAQGSTTAYQGDIFLSTWNSGSLNGVQIYNNTFYWNPAAPAPLLNTTGATFSGSNANFFKNNIVYSTTSAMIATTSALALDYNIYWLTSGTPQWTWNGVAYSSLAAYQAASLQDAHSLFVDPLLNSPTSHSTGTPTQAFTLQSGSPATGAGVNVCTGITGCTMGSVDFFGNALPTSGTGYNIGAYQ